MGAAEARPGRRLAVLTCMDARVLPHTALDAGVGDMHVVRNAGGRVTDDSLRSLVVSTRLLGVDTIMVVHHTDCGNTGTDEELAVKLDAAGVPDVPFALHGNGPTALADDVEALRASDLLPEGTIVTGHVYDVETQTIDLVVE